ncbi:MAG: PTS transporter subunit EIIA [Lentisphaerae bacterium]|nr:PTS transporter subunit EIIA [Lentisphaerota bacterium]
MELTVKDLVSLFGVPERTLYGWIRDAGLPHYRVQDQVRFNRVELLEWATLHGVSWSPAAVPNAVPTEDAPLSAVLAAGGVYDDLPGDGKAAVLAEVVRRMPLPACLDRDFILDVLLAREELGSTGIGDGLAIPHARNPIVMRVERPLIALAFLATPVDFGAMDGLPVHTVFVMITPTVRVHLSLLSRLSLALRHPTWRAVLAARSGADEILSTLRRVEAEAHPRGGEPRCPPPCPWF